MVADLKIADGGYFEATLGFEAGARAATRVPPRRRCGGPSARSGDERE
jgi:hypothetical protein